MKINTILAVENGDILGTLRRFLASLLGKGIVDALLVPQEIAHGHNLVQTLVRDSSYLGNANPLCPLLPVSSATQVGRLTVNKPSRKLGVVLRQCELRGVTELVKLQQANLDNVIIIGIDCLGTYELADYNKLRDEMEGTVEEKGAKIVAELQKGIAEGNTKPNGVPLRLACQICEFPVPQGADISLGLIGVDDGILVTLEEELADRLGLAQGEAPNREVVITKLVETRSQARDEVFARFRDEVKDIADFVDKFATCVLCYSCQQVCPICFCKECFLRTDTFELDSERYFDWAEWKGALKMPTDVLLYQLTRLNHMVASCVGCGLCESACPSKIPLTTIFRTVGDGVQKALDYIPGRSLEEELPLLPAFTPVKSGAKT